MSRLTSIYVPGSHTRYTGYSEVVKGEVVAKDDPDCDVHSETEQVRNSICMFLDYRERHSDFVCEDKDLRGVIFLLENIFSISSLVWLVGNTDFHNIPYEELDLLDEEITHYQSLLEEKNTDFLTFHKKGGILFDKVRLDVRTLERRFIRFLYSKRVVAPLHQHILEDPVVGVEKLRRLHFTADYLNRVSSLLYYLNRYLTQINGNQVSEWAGKISIPGCS
jgi:cob(I)alamin adenosyltransferase